MKRFPVMLVLIVLFLQACSSTSSPEPAVPTAQPVQVEPGTPLETKTGAVPTAQPVQVESGYPLDTKTGIQEIDDVLTAVASGDPQNQRALVQYTEAPCTRAEGLGGPPKCRPDEAEGTILEVLPFLGAEGSFIRKSEIDSWPGIDASALYAVYAVSDTAPQEQYYLPGEYVALYLQKGNQPPVALHITDGRIVRVDAVFNGATDPFAGFIERNTRDAEVILAPKTR